MSQQHDFETKLNVAIAYLITGSPEEAGAMVNVPARTVRYWMHSNWWEDVLRQAQTVKQKELDAIWTGLIHKVADKLRARVDEGDCVLDREGNIKKLPVKARDLAAIMSMIAEKRALLRGQPTSRTEKITVEQKLEQLQQGFKKISETIDAEEPDNIH